MDNTFRKGQTVENISEDSERYGELATVISASGESVVVEYPDGYVGKAKTGSKYYQVVNSGPGVSKSSDRGEKQHMFKGISKFVAALTRSADDKALIKEGLMSECGIYTESAVEVVLQDLCAEKKARLVEVAAALKADRKDNEEDK